MKRIQWFFYGVVICLIKGMDFVELYFLWGGNFWKNYNKGYNQDIL